jgi:hypothetical protein
VEGDPTIKAQYVEIQPLYERERRLVRRTMLWFCILVILTFIDHMFLDEDAPYYVLFWLVSTFCTLATAYFLIRGVYTHMRRQRAKRYFICPDCEGMNPILYPWVCGFCHRTHKRTDTGWPLGRTYLEPCICTKLAHSLICCHCRQPIIFNDEEFQREPKKAAWFVGCPRLTARATATRHVDEDLR